MDSEELFSDRFDPNAFIKTQISTRSTRSQSDLSRLKQLKSKVNKWADESVDAVKKNVFVNYQQFIDTAKEISQLENEMYQLTHLLSEQSRLITQMQEMNFTESRPLKELMGAVPQENVSTEENEKQRRALTQLSHRIEGITNVTMRSDRRLLMSCVTREIHSTEATTQHTTGRKVYLLLCNDSVIICPQYVAPVSRGRRGSLADAALSASSSAPAMITYKYETMYNLDNVAMGTEEDGGGIDGRIDRNAFRLFVFPTHRTFVCESAQQKAEWLRAFEAAKRSMLKEGSFVRQATIRKSKSNRPTFAVPKSSTTKPTLEDTELEWLRELPDELDECLAQRDFDNVVEVLFEGRSALHDLADCAAKSDIAEQLAQKERSLVDLLSTELKMACEKSTQQSGPKAARKAISLLIRLGKSSQACDLYLKHRSAAMKQACRELRIAEDPLSYQKQLTRIVLGTLCDVAAEFARLFADNAGCCSVLLLWSSGEMRTYVQLLLRHIFDPAPSLGVIGHCVDTVFNQCSHLSSLGLDLTFEAESLMLPAIQNAVDNNSATLTDAMKLRCTEEKWRPYNLQTGANLYRFLEEMADIDLLLDSYICEEDTSQPASSDWESGAVAGDHRHRLWLTHNVCICARTLVTMCQQLPHVRLVQHEVLTASCDNTVKELVNLQLTHTKSALESGKLSGPQMETLRCSAHFLITQVIPLAERLYAESIAEDTAQHYDELSAFVAQEKFAVVRQSAQRNRSAPRTQRQFEDIGTV